ncbi:MAG: symmetrical bis(5'-nucleosyl)-tetraphosphatase [Granulosicoccus sp.]
MTTYAIGDLHGCLDPLERLLEKLRFDPASDKLWFVGDLINRGPQSLETLRYVRALGNSAITVLGNHDLHALAVAHGYRKASAKDTLTSILAASDRKELLKWLSRRPLLHHDKELNHLLVHSGIHPHWSLKQAKKQAHKVEQALKHDLHGVLEKMYGNNPTYWSTDLSSRKKRRFAINVFTRMRYCRADGEMDFEYNGPPCLAPRKLKPWYAVPDRTALDCTIVFGHWSSHPAMSPNGVVPIDRGCVWRGSLAAYAIETRSSISVKCKPSALDYAFSSTQ